MGRVGTLLGAGVLLLFAYLLLPLIETRFGSLSRVKLGASWATLWWSTNAATSSTARRSFRTTFTSGRISRISLCPGLKVVGIIAVRLLAGALLSACWNAIRCVLPFQELLLGGSGSILVLSVWRSWICNDATSISLSHLFFQQCLEGLWLADRNGNIIDGIGCFCSACRSRPAVLKLLPIAMLEGIFVHQVVTLLAISTSTGAPRRILRLRIECSELGSFAKIGGRDATSRLVRASESSAIQVTKLGLSSSSLSARMPTHLMRILRLSLIGILLSVPVVLAGCSKVLRAIEVYLICKLVVELIIVVTCVLFSIVTLRTRSFTLRVVLAPVLWHGPLRAVLGVDFILWLLWWSSRWPDDCWLLLLVGSVVLFLMFGLVLCRGPHDTCSTCGVGVHLLALRRLLLHWEIVVLLVLVCLLVLRGEPWDAWSKPIRHNVLVLSLAHVHGAHPVHPLSLGEVLREELVSLRDKIIPMIKRALRLWNLCAKTAWSCATSIFL